MPDSLLNTLLQKAQHIGPQPTNALGQDLPLPQTKDYLGQGVDTLKGLLGAGDPSPVDGHPSANGIAQLLSAGLPFTGKMFHGTKSVFDAFDTSKGLGNLNQMIHFTEEPRIADIFTKTLRPGVRPNIIAADMHIKNGLDLSRAIPEEDIAALKNAALTSTNPETARLIPYLVALHNRFGSAMAPVNHLEEILNGDPDFLRRAGFDAVKQTAGKINAWAVDPQMDLKTPWGVPLTTPKSLPFSGLGEGEK